MTGTRFTTFPRTRSTPEIVPSAVAAFRTHEKLLGTLELKKGLTSNQVLNAVRPELHAAGFIVEEEKKRDERIPRPVFFGEGGESPLLYEIDAYQPVARCGLEVEAGRALLGGAVYRDLAKAPVMVDVDHLIVAVPNPYKNNNGGKQQINDDYRSTCDILEAIYGHDRVRMPYGLDVQGY